jgi:hypothetical protein
MVGLEISSFWLKVILIVVIAHVLIGFAIVLVQLVPKNRKKNSTDE